MDKGYTTEDECIIDVIQLALVNSGDALFRRHGVSRQQCIDFVNALKFAWKPNEEQEWSEEDERMLSRCIKSIESSKQFGDNSETFKKAKDKEMDWLENRLKSFRPQPSSQSNTNHTVWHNASEEKPTKLPIIHIWYHGNRVDAVTHEDTCLQAELDDINFQPDDKWTYVEDLLNVQSSWKPSEEELVALKRAGSILRDYGHSELAKTIFMVEGKLANLSVVNKSIWKLSEKQMEAPRNVPPIEGVRKLL